MESIAKHTALLTALSTKTTVTQRCKRINVEQKYPPFFRTFIAMQCTMERAELDAIEDIAQEHGLQSNPFRSGGLVSAITFTDTEERTGQ